VQGCYEAAKDHLLNTQVSWYIVVIGVASAVSAVVVRSLRLVITASTLTCSPTAIYHTIILSLSQDRLTTPTVTYVLEFLLRIPQAKTNNISDDLTILQEKPRVLRKMFGKLDVRRKSIATFALS